MGGKSKAPPPPDYSGVAQASAQSAQYAYDLGKEQLAWSKDQYAQDKATTDKVVNASLASQAANDANATRDRARYEAVYQPVENDLVADAGSYASPGRRDLEIGRAQSNVAQQFEGARQANQRALEAYGVNPNSTRFGALDIGVRAQQAAAEAAAGNQASQNVDATGRALRSEAINVGRGYPGQIAQSYGTALQAGNSAVGAQNQTFATGSNAMGTPTQWQGLGNQAIGQWGNTLTQGYNSQLAQFNANQNASSGWGSALGLIGGIATKGLLKFAEGGDVPSGPAGAVPMSASPSNGQVTDDIPASGPTGAIRLNGGEFIIPRDVVEWEGEKGMQKLIERARKERQGAPAKPERKSAVPMRGAA